MDIQEYLNRLNIDSQTVFNQSITDKEKFGSLHHLSSCVFEFSRYVIDPQEKGILETVSAQLESANFNLSLGLYRQAFSSLRLALEMGLAAIFFSAHKMELNEWCEGRIDIKWSRLVDEENGVLSSRFAKAFFGDMVNEIDNYRNKATRIYRLLSEYVHGNFETWDKDGLKISYDPELFNHYCTYHKTVSEVILFASICRYAKNFDESTRESLLFVQEEFGHISEIRELFGQS